MRFINTGTERPRRGAMQVVEVDIAKLFADSEAGRLKSADVYQRVCGTIPAEMGAGPAGLMRMNIETGELKYIVSVPFQIGHVQSNPWVPGEIVFCWETGGKAPQRTWTVMADGTGLRPLYPESEYEWVTHEAVITKYEVAIAIMGHRKIGTPDQSTDPANPGQEKTWGPSGTREKPTGIGIVNLRTREQQTILTLLSVPMVQG